MLYPLLPLSNLSHRSPQLGKNQVSPKLDPHEGRDGTAFLAIRFWVSSTALWWCSWNDAEWTAPYCLWSTVEFISLIHEACRASLGAILLLGACILANPATCDHSKPNPFPLCLWWPALPYKTQTLGFFFLVFKPSLIHLCCPHMRLSLLWSTQTASSHLSHLLPCCFVAVCRACLQFSAMTTSEHTLFIFCFPS